jgi:hypothetical protein
MLVDQCSSSTYSSKRPAKHSKSTVSCTPSFVTLPSLTLFSSAVKYNQDFINTYGLPISAMDSERRNHQFADNGSPNLDPRVIDPSTPLPSRCRTFRLSEIPLDMNEGALCQCLDSLQVGSVGRGSMKGNSKVFSLATYRSSWQVATVSFHQEPDDFKRCQPGCEVNVRLLKRQVEGRANTGPCYHRLRFL